MVPEKSSKSGIERQVQRGLKEIVSTEKDALIAIHKLAWENPWLPFHYSVKNGHVTSFHWSHAVPAGSNTPQILEQILKLTALENLGLPKLSLTTLPEAFANFTSLISLSLDNNKLTTLPPVVLKLPSLKRLDIDVNPLGKVPTPLWQHPTLELLGLSDTGLREIPEEIGTLTTLKYLNLGKNLLTSLPPSIARLQGLHQLILEQNPLATIPPAVTTLQSLEELNLSRCQLVELPADIGKLRALKQLRLEHNQLASLPPSFGLLAGLTKLYLNHNRLTKLPDSFRSLTQLAYLHLQDNQFTTLPPVIADLASLKGILLDGNPWDEHAQQVLASVLDEDKLEAKRILDMGGCIMFRSEDEDFLIETSHLRLMLRLEHSDSLDDTLRGDIIRHLVKWEVLRSDSGLCEEVDDLLMKGLQRKITGLYAEMERRGAEYIKIFEDLTRYPKDVVKSMAARCLLPHYPQKALPVLRALAKQEGPVGEHCRMIIAEYEKNNSTPP